MILGILLIIVSIVGIIFFLKPHIIKGLKMSYRSKRLGPAIDEMSAFENRLIHAGDPSPWIYAEDFQSVTLSTESLGKLEALESTAFLVIQHEKIHFEKYWPPFDESKVTNSFSVAKSIVATLIGIAIKEGLLRLDDPVAKYVNSFKSTPKDKITIRHMLQMSSGLKWIESEGGALSHNAEAYYGDDLQTLIDKLEVRRPPGEVFRYASGNTQVLAMVLASASGTTISEFASTKLWTPIQAEHDSFWNLDHKNGMEKAFCCFYATPRDFAKVGQLCLNNGKWNKQQIVDPSYIRKALTPVMLPDVLLKRPNDIYGFSLVVGELPPTTFFYARGIRGQYIICNPELDLVIVRMGHKRNPVDYQHGHPPDLFDHINAALEIIMPSTAIAP
ncbi:MAG: serine hydrolase [Saprospiraceae bacterium]|nr:serine hydrolase [Saprospiraceae bacterium]